MKTQLEDELDKKPFITGTQKITPFLWFQDQAEEAARFYASVFKNSKITSISRYGESGAEVSGMPEGSVMTVTFNIEGQEFVALNGGPVFNFTPAISFYVNCETQEEVDYYWEKLTDGGDERAQQCGWLQDRFGVSWQIVPAAMIRMMNDPDPAKSNRVTQAMIRMKKLDLNVLMKAYDQP